MGRLSKLKRRIIEEANSGLLNENIMCFCTQSGSNQRATCYDYGGPGGQRAYYRIRSGKCCHGQSHGGGVNHPMCHGMHCSNFNNSTCLESSSPGGGGGPIDVEHGLSFDGRTKETSPVSKGKGVDSAVSFVPAPDMDRQER